MDEVVSLFPVPFLRSAGLLPAPLVAGLVAHFSQRAVHDNNASANLSHSELLRPEERPLLLDWARLVTPKLAEFGALMFGETMGWSVKEMWVNLLDTGGRQA